MSRHTVTVEGRRYRIERTDGDVTGTIVERFPGVGLVFSNRAWLGHRYAKTLTWSAAVNPCGEAGCATAWSDDLPSRRAAFRWLLANAEASR